MSARGWFSAKGWLVLLTGLFGVADGCLPAFSQVTISEFLADNTLGRKDDDGDSEDWIELYNRSSAAVSLAGWSLTDDAGDPSRWIFPEVLLEPGAYLVVTASGKDRSVAGRALHTNFRLAAAGEYLGLIRPDGSVASEFAPAFPPQVADVSYGLAAGEVSIPLLPPAASGRFAVPEDDRWGLAWTLPDFDDAAWSPMVLGVGWDDSGGLADWLQTDMDSALRGRQTSVYLRLPFETTQGGGFEALTLRVRFDDGFAAYLNGQLVARRNVPIAWPGGVVADQAADWSVAGDQGVRGWYYGYYDRAADADGRYDPESDFTNLDPQWTWDGTTWALGPGNPPWTTIGRETWHPNGNAGGANVQWAIRRWVCQTAGTVEVLLAGAKQNTGCGNGVTFRVLVNGRSAFDRTIAFNDSAGFSTTLTLDDLNDGDAVDFVLDPTGTDGDTQDGCDGSTFSVQVLQREAFDLAWNSAAIRPRSIEEVRSEEAIDLTGDRDWLRVGSNVLAVQLLNVTPDDFDLLLTAELEGRADGVDDSVKRFFDRPTPGQANTGGDETLGPLVDRVMASPALPDSGEDLQVTTRVRTTAHPISSVELVYRVMFGPEVALAMADDGRHDDGAAGDGVWGGRIPAAAEAGPGEMVRWAVVATDNQGHRRRYPPYPDPRRSPQYLGTMVRDRSVEDTALPVLHWFTANASAAGTDAGARGSLFFDGEFYDNINANAHGQSTRGFPKKSYDFDFNPGHKFRWRADQPRVDDFNLLTTWADKTHLRNVLAYETYAAAGAPGHFALAVRVQLNGRFYSVANLVENGDEEFLRRLGWDRQGALYKMYNTADSTSGAEKKTRKNEGTQDLAALIRGFTQGTTAEREAFLYDQLNVPEVVNYLAARAITADNDCCHKNYYLYRDTEGSGEWSALPWDVDLSFGRVWTCNSPCLAYYDETIYTNTGLFVGQNNRIFSAVLSRPATRQMYVRRVRTLMDELTQSPDVAPEEDRWRRRTLELRDHIAPDAALDLAKWGTWGRRETITQAVDRIHREFLPGRRQYLFRNRVQARVIPDAQPVELNLAFGEVVPRPGTDRASQEYLSVTNPHPFAVDLSDWELSGAIQFQFLPGTVLPAKTAAWVTPDRRAFRARTVSPKGGEGRLVLGDYQGELTAHGEPLVLRDRAGRVIVNAEVSGGLSPAQRQLRITEIHYHPAAELGGGDAEFIELQNLGPGPLSLAGVRFTRGVEFDFGSSSLTALAPGQYVLVVRDAANFAAAYGSGLPVAGVYSGNLDNSGERLRLEDADGEPILDFAYPAETLPVTDGLGFALVVADPGVPWTAWSDLGQWRAGSVPGGTPGRGESAATPGSVVISEILTHTDPPQMDAVELHNAGLEEVDLGGWWLTDDPQRPAKFRIPSGTRIAAGGFAVFDEGDFNRPTNAPTSFGLSSHGDQVWLFAADSAGRLTGFSDGAVLPAAANGVSFGRHTNSTGEVRFPAQQEVTLGRPNVGPRRPEVVIHEIHFAPERGGVPFVELRNTTAAAVPLFDPARPGLTWRLSGIDFDFPEGIVLPPGGLLLVVGGDPGDFRRRYGVPSGVAVLGPWIGALQVDGERLVLERPDTPDVLPDGRMVVPRIVVDQVSYRRSEPWPVLMAGGGSGASLERVSSSAYGDDPANWRRSFGPPTPGWSEDGNRAPVVDAGPGRALESATFPLVVELSGTAADDGRPEEPGELALSWSQIDGPGLVEIDEPGRARTTAALPGAGRYTLRLTAFDGEASGVADVVIDVTRPAASGALVSAGAVWRYQDSGQPPPGDWRSAAYDDRGWPSGPAQLGYGDGDEATRLQIDPDGSRLLTAYFRHAFSVVAPSRATSLTLRLLRDDGAAVWLNGREAWRSNLPEGTLAYETPAIATMSGEDESTFFEQALPTDLLRAGTNVIAVEVHQQNAGSSDLSFDLELVGEFSVVNEVPAVSAGSDRTVNIGESHRLAGEWTDDGVPGVARLQWEQVAGPALAMFSATNLSSPEVVLPAAGSYAFRFTVSDGEQAVSDVTHWQAVAGGAETYEQWLTRHFTPEELADPLVSGPDADPDQDGLSNAGEFRAGTLPRDAESVLRLVASAGADGAVRLAVKAVAGRAYAVEWTSTLKGGVWTELHRWTATADGAAAVADPDPIRAGTARFYRVVVLSP